MGRNLFYPRDIIGYSYAKLLCKECFSIIHHDIKCGDATVCRGVGSDAQDIAFYRYHIPLITSVSLHTERRCLGNAVLTIETSEVLTQINACRRALLQDDIRMGDEVEVVF